MASTTQTLINWTEQGYVADAVIRAGIRRLLRARLRELAPEDAVAASAKEDAFTAMMDRSPIAPLAHMANEQHYEVPAAFFGAVLGARRKYSACYWEADTKTLEQAENNALRISCEHARLSDGQDVLELGCGWGSLTLWMAERYPASRITAVSNSHSQREHIMAEARRRGFENVEVITADMRDFDTDRRFDRVVSVEMFEHMRNYRELFRRINSWLRPGGLFFMHIFCHRNVPYEFTVEGPGDWMGQYFFSGGIMPSDALPTRFQDHLELKRHWRWNGRHYEKTANAWLQRMDENAHAVAPVLAATYGADNAKVWRMRWRMFFMACAELFGFNHGQEWWVAHYLFEKPGRPAPEETPA